MTRAVGAMPQVIRAGQALSRIERLGLTEAARRELTCKPCFARVLVALIEKAGQPITAERLGLLARDELAREPVNARSITVYVSILRDLLVDVGLPLPVTVDRGVGWRLDVDDAEIVLRRLVGAA